MIAGAMVQLPQYPRFELYCYWQPIRDELRQLASKHGLSEINENAYNVQIGLGDGDLYAQCEFTHENNAHQMFLPIQGHLFRGISLQAWLYELGQEGPRFLDGPRDRVTKGILLPPPYLSIVRPQGSRGSFGLRSNQAGSSTCNTVVNRRGRDPNQSQDRSVLQPLPAQSISTSQGFFGNVDAVLKSRSTPDAPNLDLYQQRLGRHSVPSVDSAGEFPDLSRTLHNTPELSSSSRTSSISAIPEFYAPDRNPNKGTFRSNPGSPYHHHNLSISSASSMFTPTSPRNVSVSSPTIPYAASDEAHKVIIRGVEAGVSAQDLSRLIDQKIPYEYVQYETPKQCDGNKWSVKFLNEENAEKARERLHGSVFEGRKLNVQLSSRGPRRRIRSGGSSTSTASSTVSRGPIIV